MDALYASDIDDRAEATASAKGLKFEVLPSGCRGTPNAAFLLVGPSPGMNGPTETRLLGGPARPQKSSPDYYGHGLGLVPFDSDLHRSARWSKLLLALCGSKRNAELLTALWNLDWGHYRRESGREGIPHEHLAHGAHFVAERLPKVYPRIVCPLTKTTSFHLFGEFSRRSWIRSPIGEASYRIRLPMRAKDTLIIRPPRHPSWPVAAGKLAVFGSEVTAFLSEN